MTNAITPEQRETLRSALENEHIYTVLAEVISAKAVEKYEEKHARNRNFYLTLGAVALGLLGAVTTIVVDELLDARVARSVKTAIISQSAAADKSLDERIALGVEGAIKTRFQKVDFASRLAPLNSDVRRIDASPGFAIDEAEKIIDQIEALYGGHASREAVESGVPLPDVIANRNDLTFAIETMISNLAAIGDDTLVLRLSEIAPDVTEKSGTVTEVLVQTYGRDLLAAPAGAAAWTEGDGARVATFEKYRTYALRAEKQGFPELFIAFELLIRHMANRPRAEIEQLAGRIEDLNQVDHRGFMQIMDTLATQGFKIAPDSETRLIAERVRDFLAAYADASDTLKAILASLAPLPAN